jgi:hypothetical protein
MAEELDTERQTVVTYVPAYQKARWAEDADQLGMSQSEFVRTMVQAGRRDFGVPGDPAEAGEDVENVPEGASDRTDGEGFEDRVREALEVDGHLSWDDLLARLTDDIEGRLDETLQRLQSADEVQYSGRHGGYTLTEGRR